MSCWVVPAVAADLWGMSVENVLRLIEEGTIASKRDCDFTLVDVAPHSTTMETPARAKSSRARSSSPRLHDDDSTGGLAILHAVDDNEPDEGSGEYDGEPDPLFIPSAHPVESAQAGAESSWVRVRQQVARRRVADRKSVV